MKLISLRILCLQCVGLKAPEQKSLSHVNSTNRHINFHWRIIIIILPDFQISSKKLANGNPTIDMKLMFVRTSSTLTMLLTLIT